MQTVNLSGFVENPDNPQTVTDEAFADLVESVRRDPETLAANKIAYVTDYVSPISGTDLSGRAVVIAGNKRLRALKKIHGENADVPADCFSTSRHSALKRVDAGSSAQMFRQATGTPSCL